MTLIWINFLVESGISLSVLGAIYYLFLRKETFFFQNRIFLFVSVVFSVFLPLLHFRVYEPIVVDLPEITVTPTQSFLYEITAYSQGVSKELEQTISSWEVLMWVYFVGVIGFLLRFLMKCLQIYRLQKRSKKHRISGVSICVTEREIAPFSFLNTVFIPKDLEKQDGYQQILLHEMEHVKQHHSYDILIIELLLIIQWCNPFVWLLKRAIHENHEFLADKAVLSQGTKRGEYKLLLLNECLGETLFIGSPFNYSLIKNRIKMMNKMKSNKIANVKYLLGIFMAVALITGFALENKLTAESTTSLQTKNNVRFKSFKKSNVAVEIGQNTVSFMGDEKDLNKIIDILSSFGGKNIVKYFKAKDETSKVAVLTLTKRKFNRKSRKSINNDNNGSDVFTRVERMPEYPGGQKAMLQFLAKNIKYPKEAADKKVQGRVYLKFVIEKDGNVGDVKVMRSPDEQLATEAVRVVKTLSKFIPGKQKGKPVRVWYQLPVTFRLDSLKTEVVPKSEQ